jgi:hypothetical protein
MTKRVAVFFSALCLFVLPLGFARELQLVGKHVSQVAVILESQAGPLARKSAELLQSRVYERTGTLLPIQFGPEAAKSLSLKTYRIFVVSPGSSLLSQTEASHFAMPSANELGEEGFFLTTTPRDIVILAREGRGMIYGVGKLLHTAQYFNGSMFAAPPEGIDKPLMPDRILYIPPHLQNFYEMEEAGAIKPIIEEAALWGINGISLIQDEGDNDIFDDALDNAEGRRQWAKIKELYRLGNSLGLKLGMVICANTAFKNQLTPEVSIKAGGEWHLGKLINPMIPAGRALLLRNRTNFFRDLAGSNIYLDHLLIFPYDAGGCFDEHCRPWVLTYLKLSEEIAEALHQYHPDARTFATDWFCNDDEGEMMTQYLNEHPQTALVGVIKQDRTSPKRFSTLNKRYRLLVFLDVSNMGGWGVIGAQPLPTMIDGYLGEGPENGITGLMIYSEGIYDDYNKAYATQVAWNPATDAEQFSMQYAHYFFYGSDVADAFWEIVWRSERGWVDPRIAWPKHQFIDVPVQAERLEQLTLSVAARLSPEIRSSWRWQVFEYRGRIGTLAAGLRTDAEFRADILRALDAGVSSDRLKRHVKEKQEALERYQALVTELRERIYHEPAARFPSMKIDGDWMTQVIQVPAARWREVLKELTAKLEAAGR